MTAGEAWQGTFRHCPGDVFRSARRGMSRHGSAGFRLLNDVNHIPLARVDQLKRSQRYTPTRSLFPRSLCPRHPHRSPLPHFHPSSRVFTRSHATSPADSREPSSGADPTADPTAHTRLRAIVETFEQPIDWAVAYGSGVVHQANALPGPAPQTDFLISTPSPARFHAANLRQHPSHYPLYARFIGGRALGRLQETWGAGLWYVTMVKMNGMEVKYGVISTRRLRRDLEEWDTLYVAGRLHKPVLPLRTTPELATHLTSNYRSALHLSLLLLPPSRPFTELALWEQVAGLSYSGDPRMSVPGAENPEKVKNIVRGPGVLEGFRRLYEGPIGGVRGMSWQGEEKEGEWSWKGRGEGWLVQPDDTEYFARLMASLPVTLRHHVTRHFRPTVAGPVLSHEHVRQGRSVVQEGSEDVEFWRKIVEEERFREVLQNGVRRIIRRPALTQSLAGLFTAGIFKSFAYSMAKFRKWLKGRPKA